MNNESVEAVALKDCPFCGKAVEIADAPTASTAIIHHPPYDRHCALSDKFILASEWNTRATPREPSSNHTDRIAARMGAEWVDRPSSNAHTDLIARLNDEADLCCNDGAEDIAILLDEAAKAISGGSKNISIGTKCVRCGTAAPSAFWPLCNRPECEHRPTPGTKDAWQLIADDPQLANARRKLSLHEIRLIIRHVKAADALQALHVTASERGSDWFAGDVDVDGNELVTIRADELQKLRDDREKFMWQVRDTCTRAEKAEAASERERRLEKALQAIIEHNHRRWVPHIGKLLDVTVDDLKNIARTALTEDKGE